MERGHLLLRRVNTSRDNVVPRLERALDRVLAPLAELVVVRDVGLREALARPAHPLVRRDRVEVALAEPPEHRERDRLARVVERAARRGRDRAVHAEHHDEPAEMPRGV